MPWTKWDIEPPPFKTIMIWTGRALSGGEFIVGVTLIKSLINWLVKSCWNGEMLCESQQLAITWASLANGSEGKSTHSALV